MDPPASQPGKTRTGNVVDTAEAVVREAATVVEVVNGVAITAVVNEVATAAEGVSAVDMLVQEVTASLLSANSDQPNLSPDHSRASNRKETRMRQLFDVRGQ